MIRAAAEALLFDLNEQQYCPVCDEEEGHTEDCTSARLMRALDAPDSTAVKARQQGRDEARLAMMALLSELLHEGAKALSVELQNRILALEKL